LIEREEYVKIYKNAVSLFESAKTLALQSKYGVAISLLVLSMEEFLKYYISANYFRDNSSEFSESELKDLFRYHRKKHSLLIELAKSSSQEFLDNYDSFTAKNFFGEEHIGKLNDVEQKMKLNRFTNFGAFWNVAFKDERLREADCNSFAKWLKHADSLKNKGLYVDYGKDELKSPDILGKKDYNEALLYASVIKGQVEVVKNCDMTDEEFLNFLQS